MAITAELFKRMTSKQQAKYIMTTLSKVEYDSHGYATNLMFYCYVNKAYKKTLKPDWNWRRYFYFIEPKYIPYKVAKIEWRLKGVINKRTRVVDTITAIDTNSDMAILVNGIWLRLDYVFKNYTWEDGTPFGELAQCNR